MAPFGGFIRFFPEVVEFEDGFARLIEQGAGRGLNGAGVVVGGQEKGLGFRILGFVDVERSEANERSKGIGMLGADLGSRVHINPRNGRQRLRKPQRFP